MAMMTKSLLLRLASRGIVLAGITLVGMFLSQAGDSVTKEPVNPAVKLKSLAEKLPPAATGKPVSFSQDIKPILAKACLDCHDESGAMAQFRADKLEFLLKGSESGPVIIPGKSAESYLVYLVSRVVKDKEMPPKDQGKPLTQEQIGWIRAWIDQGAKAN
jgi:hypothetical protein